MKLLRYIVLLSTFLQGNYLKLYDDFRQNQNWETSIDKFLYSDSYVDYLLKDKDVKFGYYDNPTNIIICFKNRKDLNLYLYNKKNLRLKSQFKNILTGKKIGDKWKGEMKKHLLVSIH